MIPVVYNPPAVVYSGLNGNHAVEALPRRDDQPVGNRPQVSGNLWRGVRWAVAFDCLLSAIGGTIAGAWDVVLIALAVGVVAVPKR